MPLGSAVGDEKNGNLATRATTMPMLSMFHPDAVQADAPAAASTLAPTGAAAIDSLHGPHLAAPRISAPHAARAAAARTARTRTAAGREVGNASNPYVEVAARLLSETAHDLRSPLTGVRELVRLVYEGQLGETTEMQREVLGEAIGQCDAIAALVDNMLQLDRLRTGLPRTRRRWIAPTAIPAAVDAAILSLAASRRIRICWDGFDGRHGPLFGDEQLIVRLLVNLLGNAIAASEQDRSVLVRLRPAGDCGVTVAVCDQGAGLTAEDLPRMEQRGVSQTGGCGLGLAISRTLAALHFSRLQVASRRGKGTQISFDLPAAGPASVAEAVVRWRELSVAAKGDATRAAAEGSTAAAPSPQVPPASGGALRRTVPFDGPPPRFPESAALVTLRLSSPAAVSLDAIDDTLQSDQRLHELVYRTDAARWVLLWDNSLEETRRRIASLDSQLRELAAGADFVWSEPVDQPVVGRLHRTRIRELLVRDALQASSGPVLGNDRSGRTLEPSAESVDVATRRLEEELQRLSRRLSRQTDQLQNQANRLATALQGEGGAGARPRGER